MCLYVFSCWNILCVYISLQIQEFITFMFALKFPIFSFLLIYFYSASVVIIIFVIVNYTILTFDLYYISGRRKLLY